MSEDLSLPGSIYETLFSSLTMSSKQDGSENPLSEEDLTNHRNILKSAFDFSDEEEDTETYKLNIGDHIVLLQPDHFTDVTDKLITSHPYLDEKLGHLPRAFVSDISEYVPFNKEVDTIETHIYCKDKEEKRKPRELIFMKPSFYQLNRRRAEEMDDTDSLDVWLTVIAASKLARITHHIKGVNSYQDKVCDQEAIALTNPEKHDIGKILPYLDSSIGNLYPGKERKDALLSYLSKKGFI